MRVDAALCDCALSTNDEARLWRDWSDGYGSLVRLAPPRPTLCDWRFAIEVNHSFTMAARSLMARSTSVMGGGHQIEDKDQSRLIHRKFLDEVKKTCISTKMGNLFDEPGIMALPQSQLRGVTLNPQPLGPVTLSNPQSSDL